VKTSQYLKLANRASNELRFSRETVNEDMSHQPGYYFFYAKLYVELIRLVKITKMKLEAEEATIHHSLNQVHNKVTERMHDSQCRREKKWLTVRKELTELEAQADGMNQICRSFEHRRDMLVNLSATVRAEMSSDIHIRK